MEFTTTLQLDGKTATGIRVPDEAVAAVSGSGTGISMYCDCPPSRCGGTTMCRAMRLVISAPCSRRMRCRHRSITAADPALVMIGPSWM